MAIDVLERNFKDIAEKSGYKNHDGYAANFATLIVMTKDISPVDFDSYDSQELLVELWQLLATNELSDAKDIWEIMVDFPLDAIAEWLQAYKQSTLNGYNPSTKHASLLTEDEVEAIIDEDSPLEPSAKKRTSK